MNLKRLAILGMFAFLIALLFSHHENATARDLPRTVAATLGVQIGPSNSTQFVPSPLIINPGDTVKWTWSSTLLPHSTTSGSCSGFICTPDLTWDSGLPNYAPREFTQTFPVPGTFTYYCSFHSYFMQGTIIVASNHLFLPLILR